MKSPRIMSKYWLSYVVSMFAGVLVIALALVLWHSRTVPSQPSEIVAIAQTAMRPESTHLRLAGSILVSASSSLVRAQQAAMSAKAPSAAMAGAQAQTSAAVQITEWRGEYYNNINLVGNPLVRNDSSVAFDWGTGSPMNGINADFFSVRWTRRLGFEDRTYRFFVRVDDGARLWIDGQLVIDRWQDGPPRTFSVDRRLGAGQHDVRLEMYERTGGATIALWWEGASTYPDWKGEYFSGIALAGSPALTRNDKGINFNWGRGAPAPGLPADLFSVRWTRTLNFPAGTHRFFVRVDDGARLWIDGQLAIDQWRDGSARTLSVDRTLSAGQHRLRLEMYERTGDATIALWWEGANSYPDWKGEYFASIRLAGSPALTRNDREISFNWGGGAPAAGLPADLFSVRWTRALNFSAGSYRFTAEADDGVRLWVDGRLIIDQWRDGYGSHTGEFYLSGGQHSLRMEMYERTGGAMARLWWASKQDFPDWRGAYFSNPDLLGQPALLRNDRNIDFRWGRGAPAPGLPADQFSVRWTRRVTFQEGVYRFCATADDAVRVTIDNTGRFIDEWRDGPAATYCRDLHVSQGQHRIKVEYYNGYGRALIMFWWERLPQR